MKLYLNDRYIKGKASFVDEGEKAKLSYFNTGLPKLPLNSQYQLEGKTWRVVAVNVSDYNDFVVNVDLELVNGG